MYNREIKSIGTGAFYNTKLTRDCVEYPASLKTNGIEYANAVMVGNYKKGYKDGYAKGK